jgi:ADP-ribosylglycohydrolase
MSEQSRAQAIFFGLALGDALGWPIEFLTMRKINIKYGELGIQEPPDPAQFSDDTQTSIAVAKGLIDAGEADIDTLMGSVSHHLIEWNNSPENNRAAGHIVTEAVRTLEAGVPWKEAGSQSEGNGSSIRVSPVGFLYQHDPDRLREVAYATSIATHAHPSDVAATIAAAYVVKLALDNVPPNQYLQRVLAFTKGISASFDAVMKRIEHVIEWTDELAAMNYLGNGWIGQDAVSMAVYCAVRHKDNYVEAVRRAVNIPGDSDSVGCIAGALVAARTGLDSIPVDWVARLERREELTELANQLAAKKQAMYGTP